MNSSTTHTKRTEYIDTLPSDSTVAKWLEPEEFVFTLFHAQHGTPDQCAKCGSLNLLQRIQMENHSVRLYCGDCGKYIKFLPKTPEQKRRIALIDKYYGANPEKRPDSKRRGDRSGERAAPEKARPTPALEGNTAPFNAEPRFKARSAGGGFSVVTDAVTGVQYLAWAGDCICPLVDRDGKPLTE